MEIADLNNLAEEIARLRSEKAELKKQSTLIESKLEELNNELIVKLAEADKSSWEVKGLGVFRIVKANRYSIANRELLLSYFLNHTDSSGHNDLRPMLTVNTNTLTAWANKEENVDCDKIGIEPYIRNSVSFTKK